jgi:hypothetical protein
VQTKNGETLCQSHLADQQLHQLLEKVDWDLAREACQQGCAYCGGKLAVMIPLGGFRLFVRGFNEGIAGYQIRVVLGATELFWERFGFSGRHALFWRVGFLQRVLPSLVCGASLGGGLCPAWERTGRRSRVHVGLLRENAECA